MVTVEYLGKRGGKHPLRFSNRQEALDCIYARIYGESIVPSLVYERVGEWDLQYLRLSISVEAMGEVKVRLSVAR